MSGKIATILGATGMTGTALLATLLQDDYFDTVRILVRRPYPNTNPKLEVKLVDFTDAESFKLALEDSTAIFCCIGTTQKKVNGDKELYRQIDFDIPLRAARFGKEAGSEQFIIITAVGADSKSAVFYTRLKGEVEDALQVSGIRSVHILQPSVLLGNRQEKRTLERIVELPMKIIAPLLIGGLKKYRPIHADTLAAAMLNAAKKNEAGFFKHTYTGIKELASR